MVSRLLMRLEAELASAPQALKADCLRAERAALLARMGQLDEAREVLRSLQAQYASRPHAVMSAWLSLGEGLLGYFSDMGARAALDRLRRAYALSGAAREMRLHALSAAWLAQLDFAQDDFAAMARHVGEALKLADDKDHGTLARVSLVIGQAYHLGGCYAQAQPWYAKARRHGSADGDEATLSALMHNMAWMHANLARQRILAEQTSAGGEASHMLMGAESSENFDQLVGTLALDALVPILRARILALQSRFEEALALYELHFSQALVQGLARMEACLRADMAWCRMQLGQSNRALQDARAAALAADTSSDLDDRASTHSRLAQVFGLAGELGLASQHAERAASDWQAYQHQQKALVALLDQTLVGDTIKTVPC